MTSPNGGDAREHAAADALDRYWDSLTAATFTGHPGGPSHPDELLDPDLTRAVRQLRFSDEAPRPDAAFAGRLWHDLMAQGSAPPMAAVAGPAPGAGRLNSLPRHRMVVELAVAAALLLVVIGGGSTLRLPVSLAPVAPTAAASAVEPGEDRAGAGLACGEAATPEPTHVVVTPASHAEPTGPPAPTARAGRPESC